jgi:glycosyltransferase involved in cell wall biosynthesis
MTPGQPPYNRESPAKDERRLRVAYGYEAALVPGGGITRYVQQLALRLKVHPSVAALGLLDGSGFHAGDLVSSPPAADRDPGAGGGGPVKRIKQLVRGALMRVPQGAWLVEKRFERRTAGLVTPETFDVYHETNYVARPVGIASVVSIHDLSVFEVPEHHPAARVRALTRLIPASMNRAQRVLTLSSFSARAIARRFPEIAQKVSVVPAGIDPVFRMRTPQENAGALSALGLAHRGYLLSVGAMEPRKNLAGVIDALLSLPDDGACPLVVAGGSGWENSLLHAKLAAGVARGRVRVLGAVDEEKLAALYGGARGFVFLSYYEGQGLPAQEAAASGTPVLTSAASPMADTLGDAALLADPHDIRAMAAALSRLGSDSSLAAMAEIMAPAFRAAFSWDVCVERTLAEYAEAMRIFRAEHRAGG